jgi:hypothetical protein
MQAHDQTAMAVIARHLQAVQIRAGEAITEALLHIMAVREVQFPIQAADHSILFRPDEAVMVAAYHPDHTAGHLLHQIIQVLQELNQEAHIPEDPPHTHPDHHHTRQVVHHQDLLPTAVHQVHHLGEDRL